MRYRFALRRIETDKKTLECFGGWWGTRLEGVSVRSRHASLGGGLAPEGPRVK